MRSLRRRLFRIVFFSGRRITFFIALAAALTIAALCWAELRTDPARRLDRRLTLSWLYQMRGERSVPDSVVVIEMNEASGARLSLPTASTQRSRCESILIDEMREGYRSLGSPDDAVWPRCVHAQLLNALKAAGARTIVFDVAFVERHGRNRNEQEELDGEDAVLVKALRDAGNVLIADRVAFVPCVPGAPNCEERSPKPLTPAIRDAAAATGPMLLQHSSGELVDSFLLFREGAEPLVGLPLLAWHLGRLEAQSQLVAWLATRSPADASLLTPARPEGLAPGELVGTGLYLRSLLRTLSPQARRGGGSLSPAAARLRDLYAGPAVIPFNEYGPARVLPSLAYADALKLAKPDTARLASIVSGKTVFIGYAERHEKEIVEQFATHFSSTTAVDPSGVDLLATAYANLEDGSTLRPVGDPPVIGALACLVAAVVCLLLPALWGLAIVVIALLGYALMAAWGFTNAFRVFPMLAPLAGAGLGFTLALTTQYVIAARQRRRVFDRLCQFVPPDVARRLLQPNGIVPESVHGVCLVSDAAGYTTLAERTESSRLAQHLNRYFEILFRPVLDNGGFVSDVIGDSMLAVWPHRGTSNAPIEKVLDACLEILHELDRAGGDVALPTRIGVSAGPMTLTLVGALTHFEYRAVGDMVNATNRIQALNKPLGTRALVSEDVARAAPHFVFRDLGTFRLAGKEARHRIFELVGRSGMVDDGQRRLVAAFEAARRLLELGDSAGAKRGLEELVAQFPDDGPTRYYLNDISDKISWRRQSAGV